MTADLLWRHLTQWAELRVKQAIFYLYEKKYEMRNGVSLYVKGAVVVIIKINKDSDWRTGVKEN